MADASRFNERRVALPHTLRAFQDRNYRLLWSANTLVSTCRWMQLAILTWLVLKLTDSPFLVALVWFSTFSPMFILGLVGGYIADSADSRRVILSTQVAGMFAALVMTVLLWKGLEQFWHAYPMALVVGAAWALDMPSRFSTIHDLLGDSGVTNGVALDSVGMSASRLLGALLAGLLLTLTGFIGGYIVIVMFYIISVVLVWTMKLPPTERGRGARSRVLGNLVIGIGYVRRHPTLLAAVLITIVMNLLMYPYYSMAQVVARDVLHVEAGLMGVLLASEGFGALVGAVAIASVTNIRHHGRLFMSGSALAFVALLLFAGSRWYPLSLLALLVLGLGSSAFGAMQATIVMLVARRDLRGTALGVIGLAIGANPLGALVIGAVADLTSPNFALALNASAGLVCIGLIWLLMPSFRQRTLSEE